MDPRTLKPGDWIRFASLPEEWSRPGYYLHEDCRRFMERLIAEGRASMIERVDESGYPWISVYQTRARRVREVDHWGVFEESGWVKVPTPRGVRAPGTK